jgi:putative ABC transport system permease protein
VLKFAPYVLKTLWRHRTRSLLTVSGSAVALFVFCFIGSLQEGLAKLSRQDDSVLIVFQANKFCPATSHLPQDYERAIGRIEGVRNVVPIQVFTNNCRASLDVVVFYGVPASKVREVRDFQLIDGNWEEFEGRQDAALVGETLARRRRLSTGDSFRVGGITVKVAGIYTSRNRSEEDYVYCHLDYLQRTRGLELVGTVTQHEVFLAAGADPQAVADAIDERYRGGPVQTDTRPKGVFQAASLADLIDLIELTRYLALACLALMAVLVSTTTIMTVEDRIREHAVLQTIGLSAARIFRLVLSESTLLSLLGGTVGVGVASLLLATTALSVGAEAVTIAFTPSLRLGLVGIGTALTIGVLAGIAPAWHAARADIVSALRQSG